MSATDHPQPPPKGLKGRGSLSNPEGRFEKTVRRAEDDGWTLEEEETPRPATQVQVEEARSIRQSRRVTRCGESTATISQGQRNRMAR